MAPKTLLVPALAGDAAWRPESPKHIRTVANWAYKHVRYLSTTETGEVLAPPTLFDDDYVFASWVPQLGNRQNGEFTGNKVVFSWHQYWLSTFAERMPICGYTFTREPDYCTAMPTDLPSPHKHMPGKLWTLRFFWDEIDEGPALAGSNEGPREYTLDVHQNADGSMPKSLVVNRAASAETKIDVVRHGRTADRIAACWPGAALRGSARGPRQPSPQVTRAGGLVGGFARDARTQLAVGGLLVGGFARDFRAQHPVELPQQNRVAHTLSPGRGRDMVNAGLLPGDAKTETKASGSTDYSTECPNCGCACGEWRKIAGAWWYKYTLADGGANYAWVDRTQPTPVLCKYDALSLPLPCWKELGNVQP